MNKYPTSNEFAELLLSQPLSQLVQDYVFQGIPFVFRQTPDTFDILKRHFASELGLDESNVLVVGSARIGFSLNPNNFPRKFSESSDLDIIIIDDVMFDEVWMTLLKWNYPRRLVKPGKIDGDWIYMRRKDIYWGWFAPDLISFEGLSFPDALRPIRDLSTRWFNAFRGLSQHSDHAELARREVSGRLYRTWNHAFLYHEENLRLLRSIIQERSGV